ncbi:YhjD/YihY/BrkB family envelope integrity protein [Granulicoccus sp. GXG6511]|uniref:YhjD/YihY/BrkB family envelope integrity protein n=1 Tax=Granulicoccus sp. GXG6511 TaxID=3381351 RepID=UPI003D7C4FB5
MDVQKILAHPTVAHVLRMNARFTNRLGMQFAGAVTYFSVLAMVPILMFAFAIAGMVLTEFRPDLLATLKDSVVGMIEGAPEDVTANIADVIEDAASNWAGIGIIGLLSLAYAGSGWIKNLKSAVRAQFRPEFDQAEDKSNIVVETLKNLGILLMLLLAVAVTFGVASFATSMTSTVIGWLGLENVPGIGFFTRALSLLISLAAGWILFLFLYRVLPEHKPRTKALLIGALIGSAVLAILQYFTGALVGSFLNNPAAALFGPVIVLLLFFNLFARVILMVAAWIATDNQPAVAHKWTEADRPLLGRSDVIVADDLHWSAAEADRQAQEIAKADAKLSRTEKVNAVKDALPGLSADPQKEKVAFDEAVEVRMGAVAAEHGAPPQLAPHPEQTTVSGDRIGADAAEAQPGMAGAGRTAPGGAHDDSDGDRYAAVDGRKFFTEESEPVSRSAAIKNARASMATGYAAGLATGSGLGAAAALVLGRIFRR